MNPTTTDNQPDEGASRRSFLARAKSLGAAEGLGSNSRPGLFLLTVEGAKTRALNAEDVPRLVENFSKGLAEKQGIGYVPMTSEKQQVSKLKVAIYLGELTHVDGLEVAQRAAKLHIAARTAEEPKLFKSPFDGLVDIGRVQTNGQPDVPLSDEQIQAIIRKPTDKEIAEEADRLDKIATAIDKLCGDEKDPPSDDTQALLEPMLAQIMARIKALGGTTAEKRRAAKEKNKAQTALAQYTAYANRQVA